MEKAPQYGADALILDLEDSVPHTDKDAARHGEDGPADVGLRPGGRCADVMTAGWTRENSLSQLMHEAFDEATGLRMAYACEQTTTGVINIGDHKW
jgi:HpcH/HpaI aldolase/citrate lyase family